MLCVSVLLLVFIFPVEVWIHETMLWTDKVPSGKKYIMVTIVTATDAQVCRHDNCESITDPFRYQFFILHNAERSSFRLWWFHTDYTALIVKDDKAVYSS